jgi:hypothetical protein
MELTDVGFLDVTINGVLQRLDLYYVNNRLYELGRQFSNKPAPEYHTAVVQLLVELGFPDCSHHLADRFVRGIVEKVKQLGNAGSGTPTLGLPASTEQAPSASPAATS